MGTGWHVEHHAPVLGFGRGAALLLLQGFTVDADLRILGDNEIDGRSHVRRDLDAVYRDRTLLLPRRRAIPPIKNALASIAKTTIKLKAMLELFILDEIGLNKDVPNRFVNHYKNTYRKIF